MVERRDHTRATLAIGQTTKTSFPGLQLASTARPRSSRSARPTSMVKTHGTELQEQLVVARATLPQRRVSCSDKNSACGSAKDFKERSTIRRPVLSWVVGEGRLLPEARGLSHVTCDSRTALWPQSGQRPELPRRGSLPHARPQR
jgi:hypothetical protein